MKIMLLSAIYEYGGVSSVIRNIFDILDERKHEVIFLVEKLASKHYPLPKDIKLINMDIKSAGAGIQKIINVTRHLYRIRKNVIYEQPDVVLSFTSTINCLFLLAFLWPIKKMPKVILTEHTEQLFIKQKVTTLKQVALRFLYKLIMRLLYHRADYIVTVSSNIAQYIKKMFFVSSNRVKVIYNPIKIERIKKMCTEDVTSINFKDVIPCIGTVSRLSSEKGIDFLLEGFADFLKKDDARLIIVGDGDERLQLEKLADDLGINEKVIFTGWVENPYKYLAKMDVFVLSSIWEGFPNAILEAMACNVPVIATDSAGGIRELIKNGVNGLLVKPRSPAAISEAIHSLIYDKERKDGLIMHGCQTANLFDIYKIKEKYEELLFN